MLADISPIVVSNAASRFQSFVVLLRADIFAFYARESAHGRTHTQIQELTYGMLGSEDAPTLRLHAAEMTGILFYSGDVLERFGERLGAAGLYVRGQNALANMIRLVRQHPVAFPARDCELFCNLTRTFLEAMERLQIRPRPKTHALVHLAQDIHEGGAPRFGLRGWMRA